MCILGVTYVCTHVCVGLKEKAVAACICTQGAFDSRKGGTEVDFKQDLPQKGPVAGDDDSISVPCHEKLPAKKSVTERWPPMFHHLFLVLSLLCFCAYCSNPMLLLRLCFTLFFLLTECQGELLLWCWQCVTLCCLPLSLNLMLLACKMAHVM